jgi:hypothetical protein
MSGSFLGLDPLGYVVVPEFAGSLRTPAVRSGGMLVFTRPMFKSVTGLNGLFPGVGICHTLTSGKALRKSMNGLGSVDWPVTAANNGFVSPLIGNT